MKQDLFGTLTPNVVSNEKLRDPQREAFEALEAHDFTQPDGREVGIVLPVGCGKSGLLAIAPFALKSKRALVIAPNLHIAKQLRDDLTPTNAEFFYPKRNVLSTPPYPELAEIRGTKSNRSDLEDADIVVTNIQQLQGSGNRWLRSLSADFFDLIMFDEAHHNVAESWDILRTKFPDTKILNVSATPSRADGRLMAGQVIYVYPISTAVKKGYIKRISGHRLNPQSLRYVRREGDAEVTIELEEVRRLGETDASFRRSIVSSKETLDTIVDASIQKLRERRAATGEQNLKIIASALNMEHCKQIVAAYLERDLRADFVHSLQDSAANEKVHEKLDGNKLDVIVQVRKLGEGFDHPLLSVAAVFSIFANLGPFMQFVGRIMRVIPGYNAFDAVNEGVVVFHVGSNITGVWNDFSQFADADKEFLMTLVDQTLVEPEPGPGRQSQPAADPQPLPVITGQAGINLEELVLLQGDPEVARALQVLAANGIATGRQFEELNRLTPSRQATRQAKRKHLDEVIKTITGGMLSRHSVGNKGHDLDPSKRTDNFVYVKTQLDKAVKNLIGTAIARTDYSNDQLDLAHASIKELSATVEKTVFK